MKDSKKDGILNEEQCVVQPNTNQEEFYLNTENQMSLVTENQSNLASYSFVRKDK
jgi:hypothetical protein